jgi:hypothetical protein
MGKQLIVLQCVSRLGVASQANIFMTKSYNRRADEVIQHPYTKQSRNYTNSADTSKH